MFDRYTERARRVIFLARYEAGKFRSSMIEPEHVLLALLREDSHLRLKVSIGASTSLRARLQEAVPAGAGEVANSVDLPLSSGCKKVLMHAAEETEWLGQKVIDSGHLVLGLLDLGESPASTFLRQQGIEHDSYAELVRSTAEQGNTRGAGSGAVTSFARERTAQREPRELQCVAGSLLPFATRLEHLVTTAAASLYQRSGDRAHAVRQNGWTRQQALGHLVDWAASHQQWLARALTEPRITAAGYPAPEWVTAQQYDGYDWHEMVDTWYALNRLLIHVLTRVPEKKLDLPCRIGIDAPISLSALISHYVAHCEDIMGQILARGH